MQMGGNPFLSLDPATMLDLDDLVCIEDMDSHFNFGLGSNGAPAHAPLTIPSLPPMPAAPAHALALHQAFPFQGVWALARVGTECEAQRGENSSPGRISSALLTTSRCTLPPPTPPPPPSLSPAGASVAFTGQPPVPVSLGPALNPPAVPSVACATVTTGFPTTGCASPPYAVGGGSNSSLSSGGPHISLLPTRAPVPVPAPAPVAVPASASLSSGASDTDTSSPFEEALNLMSYQQSATKYTPEDCLVRLSAKFFGCTPADLPPELKDSLLTMLHTDSLEGFMRSVAWPGWGVGIFAFFIIISSIITDIELTLEASSESSTPFTVASPWG
jgi:hypothetical protein